MDHHPHPYAFVAYSLIVIVGLVVFAILASTRRQRVPTGAQNWGEWMYESFEGMVTSVTGPAGRKYTPLVGTLFLFILFSNLIGLMPGGVAPTASLNTTIALALIVFVYVQFEGIRANGIKGYFGHFAGGGQVPIALAPLLFVIELVGEIAKPLSLAIRLYGNMFGKEKVILALIATFAIPLIKSYYFPLPIQFPILVFGVLVSFVQAFVFSLLTAIYLGLMTAHHDEHAHAEAHH